MVAAYPSALIVGGRAGTDELGLHADLHNQLLGLVYNVRAYGAKGDGVTNDTSAFTSAFTVGTDIFLPASTQPYVFSATTLTRNNLRYRGTPGQTTIQLVSQTGGGNVALLTTGGGGMLFEDLIFDGNASTIGSGNYWSGLISLLAGASNITFRRCTFQNTARSAVYGIGSPTQQIAGIVFDDCRWTNIGNVGAGNGGAGVMLEQNIHDCEIRNSRAYGRLSSNFAKFKGDLTASPGNAAIDNRLDYSTVAALDSTNGAVGIEFWGGCPNSRMSFNNVIGPAVNPGVACWGLSFNNCNNGSAVGNTVRKGGSDNSFLTYGLEVAESSYFSMTGNTISGCQYGTNLTASSNAKACHADTISANTFQDINQYSITVDHGATALSITANTFIDGGIRVIYFNSSAGTPIRGAVIADNTFLMKDQTTTDGGTKAFAVRIDGLTTDVMSVDIHDNMFGPHPQGVSVNQITPAYVNGPQGVIFHDNFMDGARPLDGVATGTWALECAGYGVTARNNKAVNWTTGFMYATTGQINVVENNDVGSLALGGTGGAGTANPTAVAGAQAGASPPAPVIGSNSMPRSGSLTFGTGTAPAGGAQVVVTFPWKMLVAPQVMLTALNTATQALGLYVSNVTNAGFTINVTTAPAASQGNTVYSLGWVAMVP